MTRARSLSYVLWSVLSVGCGGDDQVGHLGDAPPIAVPAIELGALPMLATTCGQPAPAPVGLLVSNPGNSNLVITSATATGGFAVTTTFPLTIAPGVGATIAVRAPLAVIGTDRGGAVKLGTLTLASNAAISPSYVLDLAATVVGANLVFTDDTGQPVAMPLAFSASSGSCPAPASVSLHNTGNQPITVGAASASGFTFGGFSGGTIEAGAAVSQAIAVHTTSGCSLDEDIAYQVTGTVCTGPTVTLPARVAIGGSACSCPPSAGAPSTLRR
jgi:hypothetical protein